MASLNAARAILVGGAAVAALVAAAYQYWLVVAILLVGLAAHGGLWLWLARSGAHSPGDSAGGTDS